MAYKNKSFGIISKKDFFGFLNTENKAENLINFIIFLFPILIFTYAVYLRYTNASILNENACEDCLVENIQVILFFSSLVISIILAFKKWKKKHLFSAFMYLILAILLFFWTMEEVSWGQRIFDIESGDFFKQNNQQVETTIHNLKTFGYFLDRGFLYIGIIGMILCLTIVKHKSNKFLEFFREIKPQPKHFGYFLVLTIVYTTYLYIRDRGWFWWADNMIWRELEVSEMILAFCIFLILGESLIRNHKKYSE